MRFAPSFLPTVNKQDTALQNEGGWSDSNRVRIRDGLPEALGGWTLRTVQAFAGTGRAIHGWLTLDGVAAYAFGTSENLYAVVGGILRDITPYIHDTVLANAFTTVSGSPIVTVQLPFHGLETGNSVVFANHQATIGGLTIEGTYSVVETPTPHTFTITAGANATATVSTPGGGNVDVLIALPAGLADNPLTGYSSKAYSEGLYGGSDAAINVMRDWTLSNWGENLIANPSGYSLYEYQAEAAYLDLAFNGTLTGSANGWALGTGWAYGTNNVTKAAGTASNFSQNVVDVIDGGRVYVATFTVTRTAGSLKLRMNAGTTPAVIDMGAASSAIVKSGTYRRVFLAPADSADIVFEADAAFAGSIGTISYQLYDRATRITTAPPRIETHFTDPRGIVVALGTTNIVGDYSSTLIRNSALGNNRVWVPDTNNVASEYTVRGGGGRLMAGLATRQQNLVWGDDGVFSLQYVGAAGRAFEINLLGSGCGLISRHAMAEQSGFVLWMSAAQFFIFRGVGSTSLGVPEIMPCPLLKDVFDNLDMRQALKCHAGINTKFNEAWFFYPDQRDGNECSRVVVASWTQATQEAGIPWVGHQLARTAWLAPGTFDNPIALAPPDADGNGFIFDHETGYSDNGAALGEYIQSSEFDIEEGDNLLRMTGIVPDVKDQGGDLLWTIGTRADPHAPMVTHGPYQSTPTQQRVLFRLMGRQASVRIAGVTPGAFWRLGKIRFDLEKTGARR